MNLHKEDFIPITDIIRGRSLLKMTLNKCWKIEGCCLPFTCWEVASPDSGGHWCFDMVEWWVHFDKLTLVGHKNHFSWMQFCTSGKTQSQYRQAPDATQSPVLFWNSSENNDRKISRNAMQIPFGYRNICVSLLWWVLSFFSKHT